MTVAIALSGGGAGGAFEIGALRYLSDSGRLNALYSPADPGILAGISVGALNAAFLAQGAGHIEGLTRIWTALRHQRDLWVENFQILGKDNPAAFPRDLEEPNLKGKKEAKQEIRDLLDPPPRILDGWGDQVKRLRGSFLKKLTLAVTPGAGLYVTIKGNRIAENLEIHRSLFVMDPLRRIMTQGATVVNEGTRVSLGPLDRNKVRSSPVDLILGMVGMCSGRYHTWHKKRYLQNAAAEGDLFDAVLASAAIPLIFEPVRFRGEDMADGGARNLSPVAEVFARADEIYVLQCAPVTLPNVDIPDFKQITDIIARAGLGKPALKELFDEFIHPPRHRQPDDPIPWKEDELQRFFDEVSDEIRTRVPTLFESLVRTLDILSHEVLLNELMRIVTFNDALTAIQAHRQRPGQPLDRAQEGVFGKFEAPKKIHLIAPVDTVGDSYSVDQGLILANMAHGYNVAEHVLDGKPLRSMVSLLGKNVRIRNKFGRDVVAGVTQHDPLGLVRRLAEKEILGNIGRAGFPDVGRQFIQTAFEGYSGGTTSGSGRGYSSGVTNGGGGYSDGTPSGGGGYSGGAGRRRAAQREKQPRQVQAKRRRAKARK